MSVLDNDPSEKFDPRTVRRAKPSLSSVCRKPCNGDQWSYSRAPKETQRTKGAKAQQHIEPTPYYVAPSRRLHSLPSNLAADALELFDERHDLLEHTLFLRHIFRVERAQSRQRLVQIRTVFARKLLSE